MNNPNPDMVLWIIAGLLIALVPAEHPDLAVPGFIVGMFCLCIGVWVSVRPVKHDLRKPKDKHTPH